ncbi:hypothetical protein [Sphingobacterium faecium]|uniref:hypothetical protein n=1 Tax=Sphingobacterium faecium TaxID=34087 RepID=UPI00320B006A
MLKKKFNDSSINQLFHLFKFLVVIHLILGCSHSNNIFNNENGIIKSKSIISIDSSDLVICNINPGCYLQTEFINDSVLMLMDLCNENKKFLNLYNFSQNRPLYNSGSIGKGANEYIYRPMLARSNHNNTIMISDQNGFLKEVKIQDKEMKVINEYPLLTEAGTRELHVIDDNIYGKNTNFGNGIFFIQKNYSKLNTSSLKWVGLPPSLDLTTEEQKYSQLLGDNYFHINKQKNRIISGMRYFNKVYFFDLNGELINEFKVQNDIKKKKIIDESKEFISDDAIIYTNGITSTNNYIYIIFYGKTFDNMAQIDKSSSYIIQIDWDGKLKNTYHVRYRVESISVSPDDKTLYLSIQQPENGAGKLWKTEI